MGNWGIVKLGNFSNLPELVKEKPGFKPNLILEPMLLNMVVWTSQKTNLKDMNQVTIFLFTKIQNSKYQVTT